MKIFKLLGSVAFIVFTTFSHAEFYSITSDASDAEEKISNGDMYLSSSDLEMGYDPGGTPDRGLQLIGLRFDAVSIPRGSTVDSAKIRFRADTDDSTPASFIIRGELSPDANSFTNSDYDLSSRTQTSASVNWNPGNWQNNEYYETADISSIIQEIIDQASYAGDDLVIFIAPGAGCTGSGCRRRADSRDTSTSNAPRLEINFTPPRTTRDFTLRYSNNLKGNLKVIGNTVLRSRDGYTQANNRVRLQYVDVDSVSSTFNSSSATIESTEAGVDISGANIVWAGLYWQGYLHSDDSDTGLDSQYNISNTQTTAHTDILNIISTHSVSLQKGTDPADTVTPDEVNWHIQYDNTNYVAYKYGAFADVTSLLQGQSPSTKYTISNIPTREGQTDTGNSNDGLGNYGAWSLVIAYDNNTVLDEKTRNLSVFDGYLVLNGTTTQIDIPVSGFKTPKDAPNGVDSTLSVFAGEGDKFITGDTMALINQDGANYPLSSSNGSNNFFNSSIEGVDTRSPALTNNMGIDIHTQAVGTSAGNDKPIKINHTSATIRIETSGDHFMPSMAAFATELFIPELCYDYVIQKNKYTLPSIDRNMTSYGKGTLSVGVAIRSLEGDFDLERTSLKVELAPSTGVTFDKAFYSPDTVNILLPAVNVPHPSTDPNIAIGENATTTGGTIARLQRYFTRFDYTQSTNAYTGHFDFDINTSIDFGSGPVPFTYSTKYKTIKQCPISSIYAPEWRQFNIERTNSDPTTADEIRYPLYTQIVGRDFDISIVSYDETHTVPKPISDVTLDVELIDSKPFGDQSFKCGNTFENIIQPLPNGEQSFFVRFPTGGASRVDENSTTDLITTTALENAAFRVWYLVDENDTIIDHTCAQPTDTNPNDTCFLTQVAPRLNDPTNVCPDSNCSTYISPRGEQGCYSCYRDYFAKPACSRDNFSIRPESYRIAIIDDNENNGTTTTSLLTNTTATPTSLAAEYAYRIDGNATRFQSNINALQYNIDANATLIFNDNITCNDTNDTNTTYVISNGQIINNDRINPRATFEHNNAGDYLLRMIDRLWTKVDQRGFINAEGIDSKTFPQVDDCIRNDSTTSAGGNALSGCDVASNSDALHTDISLTFEPYQFDISQVQLGLIPNNAADYLFMNDFSDAYYSTNDINMSARFTGLIQAQGKNGRLLSNYTNTCHANDKNITLILNRTTAPIAEVNLTSVDKYGNRVNDVLFQQKLTMRNAPDQILTGIDQNVTLSGLEFDPTQNGVNHGQALITLDTTYRKPPVKHAAVNPFDVNYSQMTAISVDSSSFADLIFHVPDANNTYNQSITYYFAKVTPESELYGPIEESSLQTPIFVDIYCDPEDGNTTMCADRFNLNTLTNGQDEEAGWYSATMFTPPELNTVDLSVNTVFGNDALPKVKDDTGSSTDVPFDDPGASQADINVSLAGPARPSTVDITVIPAPYLRYDRHDPNGYMHYRVKFIGNSTWSGIGNTGHTVETTSSKDTNPRMNW